MPAAPRELSWRVTTTRELFQEIGQGLLPAGRTTTAYLEQARERLPILAPAEVAQ